MRSLIAVFDAKVKKLHYIFVTGMLAREEDAAKNTIKLYESKDISSKFKEELQTKIPLDKLNSIILEEMEKVKKISKQPSFLTKPLDACANEANYIIERLNENVFLLEDFPEYKRLQLEGEEVYGEAISHIVEEYKALEKAKKEKIMSFINKIIIFHI